MFTRKDYKPVVTVIAFSCALTGVLIALYFRLVSKDAISLLYIANGMLAAGTAATYFYPEAPRYLIKAGRIDQAIEVFQQIAKFNGKDLETVQKSHF